MTDADDGLLAWRAARLADLKADNVKRALDALLSLTYHEPDRRWVELLLLSCLEPGVDSQVRALAVTCIGHVARIHGALSPDLVDTLRVLRTDPTFGGIAEDALDDVASFVGGSDSS